MDLANKVLNIVAPPFTILFLCLLVPLYLLSKSLYSVLRSFFYIEDVSGKVIIITGASSGIGEQMAYEYAKRRASLVLADIRGESLRKVADKCIQIGSADAVTVTADVSDVNDCKRIVDSAISHFGRLDHLVNNAGIMSINMLEDYEDIIKARPIMDVNFWGGVYITRFAISHLRNTRGKIIVMASSVSWIPSPRMSIYNASKAAMVAFYETLRVEIGSSIHITIVTPGIIKSEMTTGKHLTKDGQVTMDPSVRDAFRGILPMRNARRCAQGIVKGACQGKRYITEPAWFRITFWLKFFSPQLIDLLLKHLYFPKDRCLPPIQSNETVTE